MPRRSFRRRSPPRVKRERRDRLAMTLPSIRRVAVVGAGTIGASWTAYFLAHGLDVTVSDPAPTTPDLAKRTIETVWPSLVQLGLAPDASPDRVRFVADPVAAVA